MQQTKWILAFHLHMLKTLGRNDLTKSRNYAEYAMMNESDLYSTLKFSTDSDSDVDEELLMMQAKEEEKK